MIQRLEIMLAFLALGLGTLGIINLVLAYVFFGIAGILVLHLAIEAISSTRKSLPVANQSTAPVQHRKVVKIPTGTGPPEVTSPRPLKFSLTSFELHPPPHSDQEPLLWAVEMNISNPNAVPMSVSDIVLTVSRPNSWIRPRFYPLANQEVSKYRNSMGYSRLPTGKVLGRQILCAPNQQHSGILVFLEKKGNPKVSATLTLEITDSMGRVLHIPRSFK